MSFVLIAPEFVTAAAGDLTNLGSSISAANASAASATTQVLAAGADEVSARIAALFGGFGLEYQAISAQVAAYHQRFVQALSTGAGAYASAEAAAAEQIVLGVINAPTQALLGRPLIGDGANATTPGGAGTTHAARGSGIPVAAEATAATLGKAPSELVGEPTFPAVATEAAGSAGASDAAIATGAAGPAVTDQSRTVAGPTVLTGGTRPTVPAIAIQQSTRPTGLARPAVSAVADQRPANNAWVGALTALSTSCANVALAVSAAAYHPPPEVRAATNCARYAAACALICWYSCAFAPNSAAIAIDTSSAAVGRQRRRRACHERIGRADRRTDPRHICGGRGQKEGCAITNDM